LSPAMIITKEEISKNLSILISEFKSLSKQWVKKKIRNINLKYF
jgi:hypothetical protein